MYLLWLNIVVNSHVSFNLACKILYKVPFLKSTIYQRRTIIRSIGNKAIEPILSLCNPNIEVAAFRETVQLKTFLIIVISRGLRFITVKDLGLNSLLSISYIVPEFGHNIIIR